MDTEMEVCNSEEEEELRITAMMPYKIGGRVVLSYILSDPFWKDFMEIYNNCVPKSNVIINQEVFRLFYEPDEIKMEDRRYTNCSSTGEAVISVQLGKIDGKLEYKEDCFRDHPELIKNFVFYNLLQQLGHAYDYDEDLEEDFFNRLDETDYYSFGLHGYNNIFPIMDIWLYTFTGEARSFSSDTLPVYFGTGFDPTDDELSELIEKMYNRMFPELEDAKDLVLSNLASLWNHTAFNDTAGELIRSICLPMELKELVLEYLFFCTVIEPLSEKEEAEEQVVQTNKKQKI